jgi:DnaK suppressor protein
MPGQHALPRAPPDDASILGSHKESRNPTRDSSSRTLQAEGHSGSSMQPLVAHKSANPFGMREMAQFLRALLPYPLDCFRYNARLSVGPTVVHIQRALMETEITKHFTPYKPKAREEYMNPKQLAHFRGILDALKTELSKDIDRTVHTMQDEATIFADPNDRASQESDMALELRNRDRERKLIKKIEETISKIDAGEYGYCESCGIEIGLRRLEARPTATLCIDCKTLEEIREKQVAK